MIKWGDYDRGPYCRHWADPADCEIVCASCGHRCTQHGFSDDPACNECDCKAWKEPADSEEVSR